MPEKHLLIAALRALFQRTKPLEKWEGRSPDTRLPAPRRARSAPPSVRRFALFLGLVFAAGPFSAPAQAGSDPLCVIHDSDGKVSVFRWSDSTSRVVLEQPTEVYGHAVLGDGIEYRSLNLRHWDALDQALGNEAIHPTDRRSFKVTLPEGRVFEDIEVRRFRRKAPQSHSEFGHGPSSMLAVVETDFDLGAQLAVYEVNCKSGFKKIAATPHIGRSYRWLAPAGIADFDGDGRNDIAYVETPHLGKILKIVTLKGDQLVPIVTPKAGFSNHAIGEDFITSGVRTCAGRVELLTPNAARSTLMAVRVESGEIVAEPTSYAPSRAGIEQAQRCD